MCEVMQLVSFRLKEESMLEAWKEMSLQITLAMRQNASGFISRDSGIDDRGNVYCILRWENKEKMEASRSAFAKGDFEEEKRKFEALVDMQTMRQYEVELFPGA